MSRTLTPTDWYPLKLEPSFRERVWGQEEISALYAKGSGPTSKIGEVWLTADDNRVANGILKGKTLGDVCRLDRLGLLGTSATESSAHLFPLLVKFLFTTDKLSVQVHPPDPYARENEGSPGKRRCGTSSKRIRKHFCRSDFGKLPLEDLDLLKPVETGKIEHMLNQMPVQAGDSFFIPAGTIHSLGAGLTVCEIQQNSDVTYRLYDYNRLGTDGQPRTLHLEKALSVLERRTSGGRINPLERAFQQGNRLCLAACPQFVTEKLTLTAPITYATAGRFEMWIGLEGIAEVEAAGQRSLCEKGEVVVIPAAAESFSVFPMTRGVFLRTYPPNPLDVVSQWRDLGFSEQELSRVRFCPEPATGNA